MSVDKPGDAHEELDRSDPHLIIDAAPQKILICLSKCSFQSNRVGQPVNSSSRTRTPATLRGACDIAVRQRLPQYKMFWLTSVLIACAIELGNHVRGRPVMLTGRSGSFELSIISSPLGDDDQRRCFSTL